MGKTTVRFLLGVDKLSRFSMITGKSKISITWGANVSPQCFQQSRWKNARNNANGFNNFCGILFLQRHVRAIFSANESMGKAFFRHTFWLKEGHQRNSVRVTDASYSEKA